MCQEMKTVPDEQHRYLEEIEIVLRRSLGNRRYRIYLFGSRATGRHTPSSDFDVAVLAQDPIGKELSLARERLEQSNIPLKVDLIELREASQSIIDQAEKDGVLLCSN